MLGRGGGIRERIRASSRVGETGLNLKKKKLKLNTNCIPLSGLRIYCQWNILNRSIITDRCWQTQIETPNITVALRRSSAPGHSLYTIFTVSTTLMPDHEVPLLCYEKS